MILDIAKTRKLNGKASHFFAERNSWFSVSTAESLQPGSASQGPVEPIIPQFLLKLLWPPTVPEIGSKPHCGARHGQWVFSAAQPHPCRQCHSPVPATQVHAWLPFNCFVSWFPVLHFCDLFSLSFLPCVLSLQTTGCHLHSQTTRRFLLNC